MIFYFETFLSLKEISLIVVYEFSLTYKSNKYILVRMVKNFDCHRESRNKVPTNPGGAQVLGEEFSASAPSVMQGG